VPKNRRRNNRVGGKSIAVRTKHKIGGRKSGRGTNAMSTKEFGAVEKTCRKRDRNKLRRAWDARMGVNEPLYISVGVLEVIAP
jgi:hypothetical protein